MTEPPPFERYLAALEALSAQRLPQLAGLLAAEVRFVDPFHDVRGREAMTRVLAKMFDDLSDVRFTVVDRAFAAPVGFASWTLSGVPRAFGGRPLRLIGVSEIHLDAAGQVTQHIDHWDAASQLYARIPVLGWVLAAVRRRLAAVSG